MKKNQLKLLIKKLKKMKNKKKLSKRDRILLGISGLIMASIILFTAYIIWFVYSQKSIAHYLPAEKTVAYIELKDLNLPVALQTGTTLNQESIKGLLKKVFDFSYNADTKRWADGRFAVALVQDKNNQSIPVLGIQSYNKRSALKFFKELTLPGETLQKSDPSKTAIYSYSNGQTFHFTFAGSHVFISNAPEVLQTIQEVRLEKETALSDVGHYQASSNNLPRQDWARGYINVKSVSFKESTEIRNITEPLKSIVNNISFSVRKNPNGFHFNTFVNLNKEILSLKKGFSDETRFAYKLTDFVSSKGLGLYMGGANLSAEWENTLDTIANLNPAYGVILEGLIRAQVDKIFGEKVNLRNDFYPLFKGEYALAIGQGKEETSVKLLLAHSDQAFTEAKLEKMMDGFRYLAAQFSPKVHVVMLPDGTESKELIADNTQLKELTEEYEGYEVHCLEVKKTSKGFCYTITDELLVVTNNRDGVIEAIDMTLSPQFTLSQHQPFRQTISNLSKISDEVTFIDIQKTLPLIENNQYGMMLKPYIEKFDAISWVKHYFDDGVSSEGYLLIK